MSQPTCILVFGMHRCGTSATTGLLDIMGAELGGKLMPPTPFNPNGYFEHIEIREINDRILRALDSSWDSETELAANWTAKPAIQQIKRELSTIIYQQFSPHQLFAIKDPRISKLLPFWEEILKDLGIQMKCLILLRNPGEVAASLAERDGFSYEKSMLLWLEHILQAEKNSRHLERVFVNYKDVLIDPAAQIQRIVDNLEVVFPHSLQEKKDMLESFIDKSLNHGENSSISIHNNFPLVEKAYNLIEKIKLVGSEEFSRFEGEWEIHAELFRQNRSLFLSPEIKAQLARGKQKMLEDERSLFTNFSSMLKERASQFWGNRNKGLFASPKQRD